MTPLPPHADQAVRHAVDAYIDGRLLPVFEGEGSFETRNSTYRVLDGVLLSGPNHGVVGAELVGWLIEYPSRNVGPAAPSGGRNVGPAAPSGGLRAEVSQAWRSGARAVLVDTRNDGVRGPHIIVTSATRVFRIQRPSERPGHPAHESGSRAPQGGSGDPHPWKHRSDLPPLPPVPAPRPLPRAFVPEQAVRDDGFAGRRAAVAANVSVAVADDLDDVCPTARMESREAPDFAHRRSTSRLAHGAAVAGRKPASPGLPPPPASIPFLLSRAAPGVPSPQWPQRAHQRGLPLR